VGPYGVTLEGLESIGLEALTPIGETRLIVLDEVGKMESFSARFRSRVEELLAGDVPLLGTVAAHGVGFVKRVRKDTRVTLVRMRVEGRRGLAGEIVRTLSRGGIDPRGESRTGVRPQTDSDKP
jgi:nucleoside-triphosphatase THEP1